MADENSSEAASTSEGSGGSSKSTVELNVKTLDSQIYTFHVDRNMPVPLFKEKIANKIGVPVGQQRLIFRGKVLKDDHLLSEYHMEDGHTLHLVARQAAQSQPSSGTGSGEPNRNSDVHGNDANAGAPRNRAGQVSHSVVLGTLNLGDQGEGGVPDVTRIIGAVLNSFGLGNQTATAGARNVPPNIPSNDSAQASQGVETEGTNNFGGRSQAENQVPPVRTPPNHPFLSLPQSLQFSMAGGPLPPPLHVPIPDSLNTLSEFINRMEQALSQNGYQSNFSPANVGDPARVEIPSDGRGLPTPEALAVVARRAQQLLSGHAAAALSHIAGRLEREGASADPAVRSQIQTESVLVGLAMQHLGALLLELGRTTLTLRMGQSPAESVVNAGPAVYISPSGPNPIMVQPFPFQTSSLFTGPPATSVNQGTLGTFGPGDAPRNVNIHIHTGTALAHGALLVGTRAATGEGSQGERPNGTGAGDSGPPRVLTMRNVIAAAVPSQSSTEAASHIRSVSYPVHATSQLTNSSTMAPGQGSGGTVSNEAHSGPGVSVSQSPSESLSFTSAVDEINTHLRNLVDNMRRENQAPSGECQQECIVADETREASVSGRDCISEAEGLPLMKAEKFDDKKPQPEGASSCCPSGESTVSSKSVLVSENVTGSSPSHDHTKSAETVPLGLGLGGLQPKRRSKIVKSQGNDAGGTSGAPPVNPRHETVASGLQVSQTLLSQGSNANRNGTSGPSVGQLPFVLGQIMESMPLEGQGSNGQVDVTNVMSQVLNSPALNGLLAGVSEQAGIGSPGLLRNMLEQFTQSPAMRNTLDQIAQQVESQDIGNMFSGLGTGQSGGLDFSRMLQQMMPIVSQALTRSSTQPESLHTVNPEQQPQCNEQRSANDGRSNDGSSEIDLQQTAVRIERGDPPAAVFHSVVENAARMYSDGNGSEDLVEELGSNSDLANEFMEMLCRNISQRLQWDSRSAH
ncbi:ubiquitin-like domain-containing protein CIP73 isoform X2 [Macadamia integrifolia]|uniref:ubiquitin-like domain-containing protein CIP73 isoform X2 n=1 Tax=Macadamia integrifolia TaxID=60698 RepID=UPI001C4E813C|nr:ubiquitin-like domain-containing protein CIP73 isoform X2 [Macadamia integrifolia]